MLILNSKPIEDEVRISLLCNLEIHFRSEKISEAVRVDVSRNRTRIHHCCHRCDWLCSGSSVPAGPEINQFTPVGRGRKQQRNGLVLRE